MFHLRDKELSKLIAKNLKDMGMELNIMHVCGTHQDTIVKFGLDTILKECGVNIIQGPGCPVCVTTPEEIEMGIKLAESGVTIATFGDMVRVPGAEKSLQSVKAGGGDIRVVYGINEAVELAEKFYREGNGKEVVFMAVGFETTAPATAAVLLRELPENFSVVSCHRYIPPALVRILGMGEIALDGIIDPGHVSVIIG
ncbi:MAG: hydrogenase formation protein HypD, partial [Thermoplasmata archaeon]